MNINRLLIEIKDNLSRKFSLLQSKVIQPPEGYLKYPYLIPAGFYKQMWDWDGFFMGNYFVSRGKPEYLKYWTLNLIEGIDEAGYVSGCATTDGPRQLFGKFAMKPFLSQGAYFASKGLDDFEWLRPHYQALKKVLEYRDRTQLDRDYNLYYWENAMQSGADNNPALNYKIENDDRWFLACDCSTFQLREILAQSFIAQKLGYEKDHTYYQDRAQKLRDSIQKHLWCDEDAIYYNIDRATGRFNRCISYSCFVPLMQQIAPIELGQTMIKRYLITDKHMKSSYGLRSLSKQEETYNNENIIVPFSNWQGPIWPIANYIYSIDLKHYGFDKELDWLATVLGQLLLDDINRCGSMHENYHAESGEPLAPSDDHVDKNGNIAMTFNTNMMFRAYAKSNGEKFIGIFK